MQQVFTKKRTFQGKVQLPQPTEYHVDVVKDASIAIFKNGQFCKSFKIGDLAEYDSFNLTYLSTITGITDKSVTFQKSPSAQKTRLDMNEFCWRNYNFDLQRIRKDNAETSMSI